MASNYVLNGGCRIDGSGIGNSGGGGGGGGLSLPGCASRRSQMDGSGIRSNNGGGHGLPPFGRKAREGNHVDRSDSSNDTVDCEIHTKDAEVIFKNENETCEAAAQRLFQIGAVWKSKQDLFSVVKTFALQWGFVARIDSHKVECNRSGKYSKSKVNIRERKSYLKAGCTFCIQCLRIDRSKKEGIVKILPSTCYVHSGECSPGRGQLIAARRASGDFAKLDKNASTNLVLMVKRNPSVSAQILRSVLAPCFPGSVALKAQMLLNFRNRAKARSLTMDENDNVAWLSEKYGSQIENGLDDIIGNVTDLATKLAHEVLQATLLEAREGWGMANYLENLQKKESGFTLRIARDSKGTPVGVIWITPAMRAAFERIGWFLCLGAMKRQLNDLKWPYVGPVVLDENRKVTVVAEAFVNSERLDMYSFIMRSIYEMAPGRPKEKVTAIYGDCFLKQSLLEPLGMSGSTRLFWDHYHLLQQIWPKKLGPHWFEKVVVFFVECSAESFSCCCILYNDVFGSTGKRFIASITEGPFRRAVHSSNA
ncbi:MAG: hypothetical protein ACREBR_03940 [bacterium]